MEGFSVVDLVQIRQAAPRLCGECSVCSSAGDTDDRLREYLANRDASEDGELVSAAINWLCTAYPRCASGLPGKLHASVRSERGQGWIVACGKSGSWLTFDVVQPGQSIIERFLALRHRRCGFSRHGTKYVGTTCDACFEEMLKSELSIDTPRPARLFTEYSYILFRED